ncbi:hypothetical protein [Herbidospora sp. RD11066]
MISEDELWGFTPDRWIALDQSSRADWYPALPHEVTLMRTSVDVLRMACSHQGHQRERAILDVARHPVLWPLLAIRAVDWVPQVRTYARHILTQVATRPEAPARLIPTAVRLRHRKGGREVLDLLPFGAHADFDDATMRFVVEELIARGDDAALRDLNATMTAPAALLRAATHLLGRDDPEPFLTSRFAQIRAAALVRLPHRAGGFLDDPSKLVRLTAQGLVRRAGGDPARFYRDELSTPASIEGLGESGTPADAALVIPFLRHPRAKVRAAAAKALRGWSRHDEVTALIHDPSARVVAQASRSRMTTGAPASFDLIDPAHPVHVRRAGYRLLISADPWTRLKTDLLLLDDPDFGTTAYTDLRVWCDRIAVKLFRPCPDELRGELDDLLKKAPGELRRRVAWALT